MCPPSTLWSAQGETAMAELSITVSCGLWWSSLVAQFCRAKHHESMKAQYRLPSITVWRHHRGATSQLPSLAALGNYKCCSCAWRCYVATTGQWYTDKAIGCATAGSAKSASHFLTTHNLHLHWFMIPCPAELSHYKLHRKPHETVTDNSAIAVSPCMLHSEERGHINDIN